MISADDVAGDLAVAVNLFPRGHLSMKDIVGLFLATETCHDALHDSSCVAIHPADTPDRRGARNGSRLVADTSVITSNN